MERGLLNQRYFCYASLHQGQYIPKLWLDSFFHLYLNGFRFEMMDELIFYRADASTAIRTNKKKDALLAYLDAWKQLLKVTDNNQNLDLIQQSVYVESINPIFYKAMSNKYPRPVLRAMFINLIKNPLIARHLIFWQTFFSCIRL